VGVVDDVDVEDFGGDEVLEPGAEVLEVSGDVFDPVMWKGKLYENTEVSLSREITKPYVAKLGIVVGMVHMYFPVALSIAASRLLV
jgi:hypothetical protein